MKVLFIGAHCDDIELGCGGTIAKHKEDWDIHCVIFSYKVPSCVRYTYANCEEADERFDNIKAISEKALMSLGASSVVFYDLPVTIFYNYQRDIWDALHKLERDLKPQLVFSLYCDTQQDHCTIHEESKRNFKKLPLNFYRPTARDNQPYPVNVYSVIEEKEVDEKIKALNMYRTFYNRPYFEERLVKANLHYYGSQVVSEYAEGFVLDKCFV